MMRRFADWRTDTALALTIALVAVGGTASPAILLPRLALITPVAHFLAVLANAGTALVLFSMWRSSHSPKAIFVLGLSYAAGCLFLLMAFLTLPLVPEEPPIFNSAQGAGVWFYVCWYVTSSSGAFAYAGLRQAKAAQTQAPSVRAVALWTLAGTIFCAILVFRFGSRLPILAQGESLAGWTSSGVAPVVIGLLALATLLTLRIRSPGPVDRALAYSLLTLTLALTLTLFGGHRFTASFYAGRVLLLLGTSFVFVSAMQTLMDDRLRLGVVESALHIAQRESAKRVARIRALWQIASHVSENSEKHLAEILQIATANVRSDKPMLGFVSHLEGNEAVIDVTASTFAGGPATLQVGSRVPFSKMRSDLVYTSGHTLAWNDTSSLDISFVLYQNLGFRSFIGTSVAVPKRAYFLSFASPEPMLSEPFADEDVAYVEVVAAVFADRFALAQQLERLTFQVGHDALTGLDTRLRFREAVREEIGRGVPFVVAFVDIDEFKQINKREGHQFGDHLLVEVAAAFRSVSKTNPIARMSADEFGIVLRGVATLEATYAALEKYSDLFSQPFVPEEREAPNLSVAASIGAARFPEDGTTVEEVIRRAEVALSVAKSRGGSTTLVFDQPMKSILEETQLRVVELSAGISRDELAVVYQPTYDIAAREVLGSEALVRWDHPVRGRLSPAAFVQVAEENGLMRDLTRSVLRTIVRDISSAPELPAGFRIYFNLAVQMLEDIPFIAELGETLHATPGLLDHIGVEVTESAAMQNIERSMRTLDIFRSWGLPVAIDDFGTGYSSLAYLKKLTADVIKIDRSFVAGLPDDEHDVAIMEMLLKITERLHLVTLAEGVETEAQAQWLLEHGCRFGQGYLFARPDSFSALLGRLKLPGGLATPGSSAAHDR